MSKAPIIGAALCWLVPLMAANPDGAPITPSAARAAGLADAVRASHVFRTVFGSAIEVGAEGDAITLSGAVPNLNLWTLAEDVVRGLPGVSRVDNRVEIVPSPTFDEQLRWEITHQLIAARDLATAAVHVGVDQGIVTLSGEADSFEKQQAEALARGTRGVKIVRNNIAVRDKPPYNAIDAASRLALAAYVWKGPVVSVPIEAPEPAKEPEKIAPRAGNAIVGVGNGQP